LAPEIVSSDGLANQHQRAVPALLAVRHNVRSRHQCRHVQIVAAGMRHLDVASRVVVSVHFARVGKSRFFFDRKRVEFRTQHDRRPRAILENSHDSRASNSFGDGVAQVSQASGYLRSSLGFVR
jgi:hypothetical protein